MAKLDLSKREDRNKLCKRIILYFFSYLIIGLILTGIYGINFGIFIGIWMITTIGDILITTNSLLKFLDFFGLK